MSVDVKRTHTADTFAAVVIEYYRFFSFADELFVQNIQHFEEGSITGNIFHLVGFKSTFSFRTLLAPYLERK